MAANLLLQIAAQFNNQGTEAVKKALEEVRIKAQAAAASANSMGSSLSNLKGILVGSVLALPLANFIREAIASEAATKRLQMQVESLGDSFTRINLESVIKQTRDYAGVTGTELVNALSRGLTYFKDVDKELTYLNTAIGMSKMRGVDLGTAFQQLGYIMMGNTRVARMYGVSLHSDIGNASARTAAILDDFKTKFEPLAKQAGTTAEAFKIMGATISDMGERLGSEFVESIGGIAKEFNKLSDTMKLTIVVAGTLTSAVIGLTGIFLALGAAIKGTAIGMFIGEISSLIGVLGTLKTMADFKAFGSLAVGLLGPLVAWTAVIAMLALVIASIMKLKDSEKELTRVTADYHQMLINSNRARAADASNTIDAETKYTEKLKDNMEVLSMLTMQEARYRSQGIKDLEERARKEKEAVQIMVSGQQERVRRATSMNITTLAEERKFQNTMADIANASMKGGLDKELDALRIKSIQERQQMEKAYGDQMEIRLALAKKEAQQEIEIRKSAIQSELSFYLQSKDEQIKAEAAYNSAKSNLASMSKEAFKQTSDEELRKNVQVVGPGGKSALEEQIAEWARLDVATKKATETQQEFNATFAEQMQLAMAEQSGNDERISAARERLRLAQEEIDIKQGKSLGKTVFGEEKKVEASVTVTSQVNITIANPGEFGDKVSAAVVKAVTPLLKSATEKAVTDTKTHNVGASL